MKRNEIEEVINNHFKVIDRLFHKIIVEFETEDIQQFRSEVKKLRSFLHLLDMESGDTIPFKIPKKLKTFYGYMGIIRNLQLQSKSVNIYLENSTTNIPVSYLKTINREIDDWKRNAIELMNPDNNFFNDEKQIIESVPDKLRKKSARKFIQYILFELEKLINRLDGDEALHSMRKLLKDVLYNWIFINEFTDSLPIGLSKEEETRSFIEMLGHFRDKCIALVLLQTYYTDSMGNEEKKILQQIEHDWELEKRDLRKIIYDKLSLVQLLPKKFQTANLILDTGCD
jgi:CHAD domain-containing protein